MKKKAEVIAFYLPQFHQIPENDEWWEEGFTEWTNVKKSKPYFKNHYQPRIPGELGYYDLIKDPEIQHKQGELAKNHGISAFCYWHYWFGHGKQLLEKPIQKVITSGKPDFPFCLTWANETWSGIWNGEPKKILIKQEYPGIKDYEKHFYHLIEVFADHRYYKVGGKNLFAIYTPYRVPQVKNFIDLWQNLAIKNGLPSFYFLGVSYMIDEKAIKNGFDGLILSREYFSKNLKKKYFLELLSNKITGKPLRTIHYQKISQHFLVDQKLNFPAYPVIINDWDNSARFGSSGIIYHGASPQLYKKQLEKALNILDEHQFSHRLIFARAWNEWAEGNYLEPDQKWGRAYLEVIRDTILEK
ncbi:MAG: glycoside hydrolase family 99-like domain-containing protein [Cyclobacteriaceae bacterium]